METQFDRFKSALEKMLMLDQAGLDFGIYRIMNQKREDIETYLNTKLKSQVTEAVSGSSATEMEIVENELKSLIKNLTDAGVDPETSTKVKTLRAKLAEGGDTESLENEVYSHLTTFFSRYYDGGDFISQRRYKKDVYAIPYEGEEVKLHWANADQYYIKTGEYFRNYRFSLSNGKSVEFTLKNATVEQNNNIAQDKKERRFALYEDQPIDVDGDILHIYFTYELHPKSQKQDALIKNAYDIVKGIIPADFQEVFTLRSTDKDPTRTFLQKHLKDYVARNTFDYFIHKDLNGFLSQELDFYVKNEILVIDDIDEKTPKDFVQHLAVIKALKTVGKKIITFLASLEDFQKKLWLKKKFVIQADYCITLDRVPEELYPEICTNDKQREEWVKLFAIDEIKKDGLLDECYTKPLTVNFLKANPFLVLDTSLFTRAFMNKLLSEIDNLDEQCDGFLLNSENFQGLNLLQEKYKNSIKCTYIDPPYNAKSSEILYKNTFKHASWLSLMDNRLRIGKELLQDSYTHFIAIDEVEQLHLGQVVSQVFPYGKNICLSIVHNPRGQMGKNVSYTHEYAFVSYPSDSEKCLNDVKRDEIDSRNLRDSGTESDREDAATCFYPIFVKDNKIIGFGDIPEQNFHPTSNNVNREDGILEIWPIDDSGDEKKWRYSANSVESIKHKLSVKKGRKSYQIIFNQDMGTMKSLWTGAQYDASEYGTKVLQNILGLEKSKNFSYPKSVNTVQHSLRIGLNNSTSDFVLDYFAGSGTTAHAVINLNREDGGSRKYILCEMGEYFNTVTKPRIQKVIYSKDWKDGKPVSREGSSHCFKYMRLEQYEDTLNNLMLTPLMPADKGEFYDSYMLGYLLDTETQGSLFNLQWFRNPWNTKLLITRQNETKEENVDLIETFNYLIGLNVESIRYPKEGLCTVEGVTRTGERTLIIWRNVDVIDNEALNKFFKRQAYSTRAKDSEFARIYVNGDNNLANQRSDEENWKVVLTEKEFAKRMFEDC